LRLRTPREIAPGASMLADPDLHEAQALEAAGLSE
jgi:hypothetical protein